MSNGKNRPFDVGKHRVIVEDVGERWLGADEPSEHDMKLLKEIIDLYAEIERKVGQLGGLRDSAPI